VLVVGGGPGGMKAAEVAASRGHDVTLVEASGRLGGRLNQVESMGSAANLLSATAWIEQEMKIHKVKVQTQTRVDEAFVKTFKPEVIVLATGAMPSAELGVPSDGSIPVLSTDEAGQGLYGDVKIEMKGTRSLFVDLRGTYETSLVIEAVAKRGSAVTIITPFYTWGANMGFTNLHDYMLMLPKLGCEWQTTTTLDSIKDGKATFRNGYTGKVTESEYDFIVAGVHPKPCDGLREALEKHAKVIAVGDVVAPRTVMEAIREGDRAGRTI
jgi:hypothetical protein